MSFSSLASFDCLPHSVVDSGLHGREELTSNICQDSKLVLTNCSGPLPPCWEHGRLCFRVTFASCQGCITNSGPQTDECCYISWPMSLFSKCDQAWNLEIKLPQGKSKWKHWATTWRNYLKTLYAWQGGEINHSWLSHWDFHTVLFLQW